MIVMTTLISVAQNTTLALKRLAAMRVLYSTAKQFFAVQLILTVPVVVGIALVALALDKEWFRLPKMDIAYIVGLTGVFFALLDAFLWGPIINYRRELAAKIQNSFDCDVLELHYSEIKYGKLPDNEDVEKWSGKYKHSLAADLADWYRPEVDNLPMTVARVVCQRANCLWDMDLRRQYNRYVYWAAAIMSITIVVAAVATDVTVNSLFALILAPLLPIIAVGPKLVLDNKDAIERLNAMKEGIDGTWSRIVGNNIDDTELTQFSNDMQVGIFNNRSSNPLIFDWMHRRAKPLQEEIFRKSTLQYIDEYRQSHPLPP